MKIGGPENGGANPGGGRDVPRGPQDNRGGSFQNGGDQPRVEGVVPPRGPRRPDRPGEPRRPDRPATPGAPRAESSRTGGSDRSDRPDRPSRPSSDRFSDSISEPGYVPGTVGDPTSEGWGDVDPTELQDEPGEEFSQADVRRTTESPHTFRPRGGKSSRESGDTRTERGDEGRESYRPGKRGSEGGDARDTGNPQPDQGQPREGGRHQAPQSFRTFEMRSRGFFSEAGHRVADRFARRYVTPPEPEDIAKITQKRNTYLAKARVRRLPSSSTKFIQGSAGAVTSGAALAAPELMSSADPKIVAGAIGVGGVAWAAKGAKEWFGKMKDNIHLKAGTATAGTGLATLASAEWKVATAAILVGSVAWAGKGMKNGIENGFLWPHYEKKLEKANTKLAVANLEVGQQGKITRRLDEIASDIPKTYDPRERRRLLRERDQLNRKAQRRTPGFWKQ